MKTEILKELANQNITKIFDAFGFEYFDRYSYYNMKCPIHKGDNESAFSWVKDKGYFRCFTRHCEQNGADVFDLVRKYKKCSFEEAKRIVEKICIEKDYIPEKIESDIEFNKYIKNVKTIKKFTFYEEDILDKLKEHPYLINRGFSQDIITLYKIGLCTNPESKLFNRICIPVREDKSNKIIGFTGRTIDPKWKEKNIPKWQHTPGLPKGHILFNLNRAKTYIKESGKAILVEGPLDVLKFEMAGIHNSVAILGTDLSGQQRSLLLEYDCYDIILAMDNDNAGLQSKYKIIEGCKRYFNIFEYKIEKTKDIGEMDVKEIENLHITKV